MGTFQRALLEGRLLSAHSLREMEATVSEELQRLLRAGLTVWVSNEFLLAMELYGDTMGRCLTSRAPTSESSPNPMRALARNGWNIDSPGVKIVSNSRHLR